MFVDKDFILEFLMKSYFDHNLQYAAQSFVSLMISNHTKPKVALRFGNYYKSFATTLACDRNHNTRVLLKYSKTSQSRKVYSAKTG